MLLAAIGEFSRKGYSATSMADIGAAADVTGAKLYDYFDSKAELLRAGIERGAHALWFALDTALRSHHDPAEALPAVVEGYVRVVQGMLGLRVDLSGDAVWDEDVRVMQRDYVAEWVSLLARVRPDLEHTEARVLVRQAFCVIDDLGRTPRLTARASFVPNVSKLALAILSART